jgi:hypothetical protein
MSDQQTQLFVGNNGAQIVEKAGDGLGRLVCRHRLAGQRCFFRAEIIHLGGCPRRGRAPAGVLTGLRAAHRRATVHGGAVTGAGLLCRRRGDRLLPVSRSERGPGNYLLTAGAFRAIKRCSDSWPEPKIGWHLVARFEQYDVPWYQLVGRDHARFTATHCPRRSGQHVSY